MCLFPNMVRMLYFELFPWSGVPSTTEPGFVFQFYDPETIIATFFQITAETLMTFFIRTDQDCGRQIGPVARPP